MFSLKREDTYPKVNVLSGLFDDIAWYARYGWVLLASARGNIVLGEAFEIVLSDLSDERPDLASVEG